MIWYVVRTNPQCERRADKAMREAGFATYFPMIRRYVPHHRHKRMVHRDRPLLVGYVFVELPERHPPFGAVRKCDGVKGFVGNGADAPPVAIPDSLVEAIQEWVGREWLQQDVSFRARRRFRRAGRRLLHEVTLASGDREGFAGRLIRRDSVAAQVLVQVFEHIEETVTVPVDDLLIAA